MVLLNNNERQLVRKVLNKTVDFIDKDRYVKNICMTSIRQIYNLSETPETLLDVLHLCSDFRLGAYRDVWDVKRQLKDNPFEVDLYREAFDMLRRSWTSGLVEEKGLRKSDLSLFALRYPMANLKDVGIQTKCAELFEETQFGMGYEIIPDEHMYYFSVMELVCDVGNTLSAISNNKLKDCLFFELAIQDAAEQNIFVA